MERSSWVEASVLGGSEQVWLEGVSWDRAQELGRSK